MVLAGGAQAAALAAEAKAVPEDALPVPVGRGGASGSVDDDARTAYPIDAGVKGPTGSVRGWVGGFADMDAARAVVSIGGVQVGPTATGVFFASGVSVGGAVSIFVRASGYSTAHAILPIHEGEVTPVLLDVTKLTVEVIADPKAAHESMFGSGTSKHALSWPADSLQSVYGTPPAGEVHFESADLGARLAPASLSTSGTNGPQALRAFAAVEFGLSQPRATLLLTKPATLTLHAGDTAGATPSLYRFDERSGSFAKFTTSTYDAAAQTLTASVDRLGTYAAAILAPERGCVAGRIADVTGAGIPGAVVRYRDATNREAGLVWTQSDGRYCLPATLGQPLTLEGLGLVGGGLVKVAELALPAPPCAATCGGNSCSDAGMQSAVAQPFGCARGRLSTLDAPFPAQIRATGDEASRVSTIESTKTGESFCLDLTRETTLEITGTRLQCEMKRALALPVAAASCAENNCVDLGEFTCCNDTERCGGGIDEDCDGRVDEGCDCNGSCLKIHNKYTFLTNHCCTTTGGCGFRYPTEMPVDHCFGFSEALRFESTCPSEQIMIDGKPKSSIGCCRSDNQCGLNIENACVLRNEIQYLMTMSLAPIACTYQ
jgi:hypothetical protein